MQQIRVIDTGLVKVIVSLHFLKSGADRETNRNRDMGKEYQDRINQCINAYKDIIMSQITHPEDDDYEMLASQVLFDLERAIADKVKQQLLLDLKAYLREELPF